MVLFVPESRIALLLSHVGVTWLLRCAASCHSFGWLLLWRLLFLWMICRCPIERPLSFVWIVSCRIDPTPALVVTDLSPTGPASVLASRLKAGVQFHTNDTTVQQGGSEIRNGQQGILPVDVFDESKTAGRLLKPIHSHDDPPDGPDLRKMRMDVVGPRRKGHVANVDGARFAERLHLRLGRIVVGSVPIQLFFLRAVGEQQLRGF